MTQEQEDELLKAVALRNVTAIVRARQRAEAELIQARDALEVKSSELAHSLGMLHATLDSVTDGIMVTDCAGRVVSHNAQYLRIWNLPEPALREADHQRIPELARHFADPQAFQRRIDEIQASDPPSTFDVLRLLDGRILERHSRPQEVEGRIVGRVWSFKDITDASRAQAEREALLNEVRSWSQRLEDIFRQAPAFMCVLRGPDHVFEMVNERYLELVGNRQLIGLPVRHGVPEAQGQGFVALLDGVFRTGETYSAHNASFMVRRGGDAQLEERRLDFVFMPLRDPGGAVSGVLVHGVDLTDRYRAEAATLRLAADLAESDRRKTEFLATLAHELRNPLAPIRNGLEIIRRTAADPTRVEHVRQVMDRQLSHLVRLVDDLLDVARISQGKLELRKESVPLQTVIAAAVETCTGAIETQGHRLTLDLPSAPLLIEADPHRLAQVVTNLLNNAVKYTPAGGQIELRVALHAGEVELQVRDNGIGIEAGSLGRIFELFTQVDSELGHSRGGLGIGLSLARLIVELHGGRLTAASEGPDRGSVFSIWLPVAAAAAGKATSKQVAPVLPPAGSPAALEILVVDDNEDAAATLGALLELGGHSVRVVHCGRDAIAAFQGLAPRLVFLDIGMPEMNGYQVARVLRGLPGSGQAMLVALTGWGAESDRQRSMEAGFDLHVTKPIDPAGLDQILARLLAEDADAGSAGRAGSEDRA